MTAEQDPALRILVADDDRTTRLVLRGLLEGWGHQVVEAADGVEAREILGTDPPHIAVLDWHMPGPDGLQLCQELAAEAGRPLTYRILLTVRKEREHRLTGLEAGAHDFITKPADPEVLRARVLVGARLVAADRARREQADLFGGCLGDAGRDQGAGRVSHHKVGRRLDQ